MGFTKLDSGIVDSSVWSEPPATRVVWVTMLAKCDNTGMVRCSRSGLLRAANVPKDDFDSAISCLEAPDPESRTKEDEGRRIRSVEGGWIVINYMKYRSHSYSDSPEAIRQRRHRDKDGESVTTVTRHKMSQNVRDISASSSLKNKIILKDFSWIGILEEDKKNWAEAYPACDIEIELKRMIEWVKSNPARGKKSQWRRFINSWLTRSQDQGGTRGIIAGFQKKPETVLEKAERTQQAQERFWAAEENGK